MTKPIPQIDLTTQAPRSPRVELGGYVILARAIDKGRATLLGKNGEYHFNCPLDNRFLSFTAIKGEALKELLATGATDQEVVVWVQNQVKKSPDQINQWSQTESNSMYYQIPEKREWFVGVCKEVGLDPKVTSLFTYLEADDKKAFIK